MKRSFSRRVRHSGMTAVEVLMSTGSVVVAAIALYLLGERAMAAFVRMASILLGWPFS